MLKKILLGLVVVLFIACVSSITSLFLVAAPVLLPGVLISIAIALLIGLVVAALPDDL